jgi:hypothetical protein
MKNRMGSGVAAIALGLAIAWGPRFVFKVCAPMMMMGKERFMTCHWTAQAEIGTGMLIALLGFFLICCPVRDIRLGITVGIFGAGILTLLFPHVLIGGCQAESMACNTTAFPVLSVLGVSTLAGSAMNLFHLYRERRK